MAIAANFLDRRTVFLLEKNVKGEKKGVGFATSSPPAKATT
jgi:hypothetical protein